MEETTSQDTEATVEKAFVPHGIISFDELDEVQRASAMVRHADDTVDSFQQMVNNIIHDDSLDRESALNRLVNELTQRIEGVVKIQHNMKETDGDVDGESASEGKLDAPQQDLPNPNKEANESGFLVWKDKSGVWRWMAVYSNKFRDDDYIPEIISEKSHKTFERLVDDGIVPMPELWAWHIPGSHWGQADMVTYSDGFSLAVGHFYEGKEQYALHMSEAMERGEDIAVSHGMPAQWIIRNEEDPTTIDFHITREISPLPRDAAANKMTGFVVFKELGDTEMPIPEAKKEWLKDVVGLEPDFIESLESGLAKQASDADEAGIESKEVEDAKATAAKADATEEPKTPEEPAAKKEETTEETTDEDEETSDSEDVLSRNEVAEALKQVAGIFNERINDLNARLGDAEAQIKELTVLDASLKEQTPTDSLSDMIRGSVIGDEAARVDGRKKEAKDGPVEREAVAPPLTPVPFINDLLQGSQSSVQD